MERKIFSKLLAWKDDPSRKPLLLYGARQVGKTHTLLKFAHTSYTNYVYLNFEDSPLLKTYFTDSLDPKLILDKLVIHFNQTIHPKTTLIIFDEVQECPEALNSLKYFNENANDFHICACGSLLGVKMGHQQGFPVGKVNFLHLYPLSFFEFLDALNETRLKTYLLTLVQIAPIPEAFHQKLSELLRCYYYTGGMPEAVLTYINTHDFHAVRKVHRDILKSYELDFSKHAGKHLSTKLSEVWQTIPSQLAKENKKFMYTAIRPSARAREYEEAIQWLHAAGLIYKIYHNPTPKLPLQAYADFNVFKLYLLDVGLLNTTANLPIQTILQGHQLFQEFKGSLTENFVFQTLAPHVEQQYYWTSAGTAEIDSLLQIEENIVPLEIKSNTQVRSKSIAVFQQHYHPLYTVRTSMLNLKQDDNIINIPLYCIDQVYNLSKYAKI